MDAPVSPVSREIEEEVVNYNGAAFTDQVSYHGGFCLLEFHLLRQCGAGRAGHSRVRTRWYRFVVPDPYVHVLVSYPLDVRRFWKDPRLPCFRPPIAYPSVSPFLRNVPELLK